jgi:transposase
MRAASDVLFYLLRTGCPWRYLPREDRFPPRSTVYNIFRGFQRDGAWDAIAAALVKAERERQGRKAQPTAGILDSQTAKAAERGAHTDPVGYDAGKRTNGRKRHGRIQVVVATPWRRVVRWRVGDVRIGLCGRSCDRQGGLGWECGSTGAGSGRWWPMDARARTQRWRWGYHSRSGSAGFGRRVVWRHRTWHDLRSLPRGATSRSLSGRRLRCCRSKVLACVRLRVA